MRVLAFGFLQKIKKKENPTQRRKGHRERSLFLIPTLCVGMHIASSVVWVPTQSVGTRVNYLFRHFGPSLRRDRLGPESEMLI